MLGLMMDRPLLISQLIEHAAEYHGDNEIVSRSVEGPIHRHTYADAARRSRQLAKALKALGVAPGDRIGTLAWNGYRHFEIYFAVSGIGAICHTINPRLFPEQIAYIINHADDRFIFADLNVLAILEGLEKNFAGVRGVIVMTDRAHMPADSVLPNLLCYEDLAEAQDEAFDWPEFDENTAASLCYTSGTTGNPKGVLYSHRSTILHAYAINGANAIGLTADDAILPVVPMFHANAWGIAFSGPAVGARIVMPGPKMDGASIFELLEREKVTFTAAVPTVWQMLLGYLRETGQRPTTLKRVVIGGAAPPPAVIEAFENDYNIEVIHAWGMTELSPMGSLGTPTAATAQLPRSEQMRLKNKQGRPPLGVEMKIVDDQGLELPRDGKTFGRLVVRGAAVARAYFKGEGGQILDADGFFDTGDVATLDGYGFMQITDRAKDVIKSGGEWISSIEVENLAMTHPKVALAAVIGVPHPKWDERPLLVVELRPGESADKAEMLRHLDGKIAKWWMPDDVVFVDKIALGATGKIDKKVLRAAYRAFPAAI